MGNILLFMHDRLKHRRMTIPSPKQERKYAPWRVSFKPLIDEPSSPGLKKDEPSSPILKKARPWSATIQTKTKLVKPDPDDLFKDAVPAFPPDVILVKPPIDNKLIKPLNRPKPKDTPPDQLLRIKRPIFPASLSEARRASTLCSKNYSAMEATTGKYGIIDNGLAQQGIHELIAHIPRLKREYEFDMRPGDTIQIRSIWSKSKKDTIPMRVIFTSPSRYYSPGTKVTSLLIGVLESDWQKVMPALVNPPN